MVFLSGSIYKTVTSQSQTVLGHFSEGHFAVTSQTIPSFGEKKTVCVFVKRKCGLNEDLYDSEQFTYNVLCQLLPYNDITALLVAHELFSALSNCFGKKTRLSFYSKLELNISTHQLPVWDVLITSCFRQLNIRRKNNIFLIRYLQVLDIFCSRKKAVW